ncbi:MAG: hypothetical protein VX436_03055 [Planctomycetota bacterium]|nr:hypothetical protein [Planctomycetota bacterium]
MTKQRILVCPICGETQRETSVCCSCETSLDPNGLLHAEGAVGPWWVRNEEQPFCPGMTYDHIVAMARKGEFERHSLVRGPTTRQLWTVARHVPGIAHILGRCHKCDAHVSPKTRPCPECKAPFLAYRDRNNLGLDNSDPSEGEIDGMSSFLNDTSILDTMSAPLTLPNLEQSEEPSIDSSVASPEFRSIQRRLEQSKRTGRILGISLIICVIMLIISLIILLK